VGARAFALLLLQEKAALVVDSKRKIHCGFGSRGRACSHPSGSLYYYYYYYLDRIGYDEITDEGLYEPVKDRFNSLSPTSHMGYIRMAVKASRP
jgi:hypothetical protein